MDKQSDFSDSFFNRRGRRVMICVRGDCAPRRLGKQLEARLTALIQNHGLDDPDHDHYTRCTITNCLAVCEYGPVLIVHPEGIRYRRVDAVALERIFYEHLCQDKPVVELMVQEALDKQGRQHRRKRR